ncbi:MULTISPECIES: hypothetical protein [Symbiopectobacterium]|uniref:hypothetical protein n=1 Tax=Symbiopectobacterium TaxID=801 RepID=UPI001A2541D0|nr:MULTISPECIES: hypothetical protein [Symbiopectobacterium]MBG6247258.1 hypothetical protein [Candidatus Symbiopectobacterium sp. PLON1]MBT9428328.1 hypothetical protein [Candidatus Symbiopectobacterium endolongispinus]
MLQNLGNGNVTVSASDSVGNSVSLGGGLTLGFSLPVVTLNPFLVAMASSMRQKPWSHKR